MTWTSIQDIEAVPLNRDGGLVANSLGDRLMSVQGVVGADGTHSHLPLFTGAIYYVDAAQADDTGDGGTPHTAKKTISAAIAIASSGDAVTVKNGTYAENVTLAAVGLELWCEIGTFIAPAAGVALTVSANSCRVRGPLWVTAFAGQVGITISSNYCNFHETMVMGGTTGFNITGLGNFFFDCRAGQQTAVGFSIAGTQTVLQRCSTVGIGASIGYYINNGADIGILVDCTSTGHETSGYQIDAGSQDWTIKDCSSGGGDGDSIDNGVINMWANFLNRMESEHHEHLYPMSDGEGTAGASVVVTNSTTDDAAGQRDDQNYWGDPYLIIPPSTLTDSWNSLGIYIDALIANKDLQWEIFFPQLVFCSAQNGGNDWDIGETALTVTDGTLFIADDLVWITGDDVPNGEILKVVSSIANVVTVVSETRMGGGVGVRYDYDIAPGNNAMYVVHRDTNRILHGFNGSYSAASAKDFARFIWHDFKQIDANGGMIMRLLNATDALAVSMGIRAIYED